MLPPPDDGGAEDDDSDDEGDVPWAGEGYQRSATRSYSELWIGVLPQNLGVVQAFLRCQPQVQLGMGVFWQGVTAAEVHAACVMARVPRAEWERYLDGVQSMARIVAGIRNEESAKGAKGKKK